MARYAHEVVFVASSVCENWDIIVRMKRRYWILGAFFLILGLVFLYFRGLSPQSKRLRARLDAIRQAGDPLTPAEFQKMVSGDLQPDENGASLIDQAGSHLMLSTSAKLPYGPVPPAGQPAFDAAAKADVEALLASNTRTLALLHQAGRKKAAIRNSASGTNLPPYVLGRQMAYLLKCEAIVASDQGRADDAIQALQSGFLLADSFKKDRGFSAFMVGVAVDGLFFETLERIFSQNDFSPEQAATLRRSLEKAADTGQMAVAWQGERTWGLSVFDEFRKGNAGLSGSKPSATDQLQGFAMKLFTRLDSQEAYYLDVMSRLIELSRMPCRKQILMGNSFLSEVESHFLNRGIMDGLGPNIPAMIIPNFTKAFSVYQASSVRLQLALAALAVKIYWKENRKLPDSLQTAGDFLHWTLPTDPFTEKPFLLLKRDNGFILYSVGPDGRDDAANLKSDIFFEVRSH